MTGHQPFAALGMPLDGIRLIEASAGTGKTHSLAGLYLRLLAERRLEVRQILVMTFTRAATHELRDRIRRRIADAARIAIDPATAEAGNPEHEFAEELFGQCDDTRPELARRLLTAARDIDQAAITTIHGFSQSAVAENAFDSALPFDRGEQVDDAALRREAVTDYWRSRAYGPDAQPGFSVCFTTPDNLEKTLAPFWPRPQLSVTGPDEYETRVLLDKARKLWDQQADTVAGLLGDAMAPRRLYASAGLKKLAEDADGMSTVFNRIGVLLDSEDTLPLLPAWIAQLDGIETQFQKNARDLGEELAGNPLLPLLADLHHATHAVAIRQAHSAIRAAAAGRKAERRQFSFEDMISTLHSAVTDPGRGKRLADALHAQWPWILVDEFQDTDPLQYHILQRVHANRDQGGLFLIGDPKQAIFGFRGGDVFAYLNAVRDASQNTGDRIYTLAKNWRSTQLLLDGIETLFRAPESDPFLAERIDYVSVTAGNEVRRDLVIGGDPVKPLTFWPLDSETKKKPDAQQHCLRACVGQVQRLLDAGAPARIFTSGERPETRDLRPADIGILVNTNDEAARVQRALSRSGIAAACLHQQSVYHSSEADDLLKLLRAASEPANEGLLRGALATPLLGKRLGDLIALEADEAESQQQAGRMLLAHESWRTRGVLAMLQPFIQSAAERLLDYEDGERRLSNYLQLAELLAGAEQQSFGMPGLIHWLREAIEADSHDSSGPDQLRLESDEALVRISTVHKAKGLEYPVVLIPFAPWTGAGGQPGKTPLLYHDEAGDVCIDYRGDGAASGQAVRESRAEGLRLLYVAMTRAAVACFLPWGAANGTPNSALASLLHRDLIAVEDWYGAGASKPLSPEATLEALETLAKLKPEAIAITAPPVPQVGPTTAAAESAKGEARTDLPARRAPWFMLSFSRLVRQVGEDRQAVPTIGGAEDEITTDEITATTTGEEMITKPAVSLPGGTAFGSAVHALLENRDPDDWRDTPATQQPELLSEIAAAMRDHGVSLPAGRNGRDLLKRILELLHNTVSTPLPQIGPLADIPTSQRCAEMQFLFRLGGSAQDAFIQVLHKAGYARGLTGDSSLLNGLMHGFIDLVVEHDDRWYVLDYKTNWLGDAPGAYAAAGLRQAIDHHHYDLQYLIYLIALHRYLGQRLPGYDPATQLGGAQYLFVRGMHPDGSDAGVHLDRPETGLILELDALLDAREKAA